MRAILFALALVVGGCNSAPSDDSVYSQKIAAVAEANAPTISDLQKTGLQRVDDHGVGFDCGDGCTGDGFDALYFGKLDADEKPLTYEYICPVMDGPMEGWKCLAVEN
ncbi:hypothetical protein [Sphingopyxis sp. PET50]|uniref:hypothetical protein n=1 Tax=Sphingopyxis sp. PET50 TaxID=2976533 RepID=UPI0021AEBE8A|nr:hypothetical protein [Sphingopyxis sp. PET50]